ncbi:MAG: valyl-tRNA synthetase, valyl-tRNA synthetase [candidate division WWE3 bacterium GW2011_GWC1_41_7]|uniref:Valine--tRNA ligase n=3 Tax=Katanobacteria TaxID=422282 RepID=A0A0G0X620_UNCKA|nr:MAG: Valine-tRNA ligase [candidate division WWE3 bacterium GW2011_GWB1_41_6]KKS20509.1 MAG: valyl-tRNA synthetase, valyl-tRNA synthetase [candidate division WWE3 bacterium GW2011_GWC1_41_7]HLC93542.1 valine--tRNA ligase [Patescibacteria group bacterium]
MDKTFEHKTAQEKAREIWEKGGFFKAHANSGKEPFTILLPPPNASGKMHTGNVLMIALEDLLIRWKRMQGYEALWVPGTDHAGFETQTTFERELKKEGKSRFDFDRNTLYSQIVDFVQQNKHQIENQIKEMGASVDWSRYTFTLDEHAVNVVLDTFEKMVKDGLIYRSDYVVNYSFKWGTTFSDAEIVYKEQKSPLYYIRYGPLTVATVRPESKLGDTALAVNPNDDRYKEYVGKDIEFEDVLGPNKLKVIADPYVDIEFGTGVLKVTPAHDKNDYEIGLRHGLEIRNVVGINGRMTENAGKYAGMKVLEARKKVIEDLNGMGLIEKVDEDYENLVPVDYRSGDYIEQLVMPNWFVKVEPLRKPALDAVLEKKVNIYPKWREITYLRWMENMRDWPISRQIVWGIRIPAWYSVEENPDITVTFLNGKGAITSGKVGELLGSYTLKEIEDGLQSLVAPKKAVYVIGKEKPGDGFLPETDTFDTWFSSGQWPLVTLKYPDSEDFKYFYPTSVLETGWEIVTRWVSRMIMFGIYLTGQPPFKDVYLHGHIRAIDGRKMSKSLGNVINPDDYIEKYGVDALRMGLINGTANGKDFNFPHDKILGYRNFANKIWNMARFMLIMTESYEEETGEKVPFFGDLDQELLQAEDLEIMEKLNGLIGEVDKNLEKYRFADAGDAIYHFMWDELASGYIEKVKGREDKVVALCVLRHTYVTSLKLLHPFMPFATEHIWSHLPGLSNEPLAISKWPGDQVKPKK